jgi:hypothetical protein
MGRRKTVMKLTRKRGRPAEQKASTLMNKFMERYMKLAKDLKQVNCVTNTLYLF